MESIIRPPQQLWRALLLSRDPDGPFWAIVTVAMSDDVKPTTIDRTGRYTGWDETCAWVGTRLGQRVELEPLTEPLVWGIRVRRPR